MSGTIAVLNAGSSSIKFALYEAAPKQPLLFRGQVEGIGVSPRLIVRNADGASVKEEHPGAKGFGHEAATKLILETAIVLAKGVPVAAVGHRIVHGGANFAAPVRVDAAAIDALALLSPLAPLHQPHNLAPIKIIAEAAPDLPQVACFDTGFHHDQPRLAYMFALPRAFSEAGVRRYGFHGLSYEYVSARLREIAPDLADKRVIIAHLGNGASMCALNRGRSVATTMGFTAVDGLVMGTRSGALDPGAILYLMDEYAMDARAVEDLIYRKSGLLGVSGLSSDMRTLRGSDDPAAAEAIALFVYRAIREVGSLAAALGGLDALVFTGGIGEHDKAARAEIMAGCKWLGLEVDEARNAQDAARISADASRVSAWIVPTDEERMIARHTSQTLGL